MRPAPILHHTCKVPRNDRRERGRQKQHIGDLLRLRNGEEYEDEDPPHLKKGKELCFLAKAAIECISNRLHKQARPREKAENDHGQIEPPVCAHGMQRHSETADVVKADELVDERHAVYRIHIAVPRQPDRNDKQQTAHNMHPQELFKAMRHEQVEKYDRARKYNADRPLRHDGKAAGKIHQPIMSVDKAKERRCHEKEQCRIGHGCLPHIYEHDTRPHDDPRPKARTRAKESRRCQRRHEDGADRHERGGQARRRFAEAPEELERCGDHPVEDRRLIVPILIVDARRKVVAESDHLLRRLSIDRLVRIEQRRSPDAVEDLKRDDHEQQEINRPRKGFIIIHTNAHLTDSAVISCIVS